MTEATLATSDWTWRDTSAPRRLVIVADDSLIVQAVRIAFRQGGEFKLVGYADARRTSAQTILGAEPEAILLDDMQHSERALQLLVEIRARDANVALLVLALDLGPTWLSRVFDAGATAAISKATHPLALATLVRETIDGRIVHRPPTAAPSGVPSRPHDVPDVPLTARELEILGLVASGATNGVIARRLWVTEQTVKFHLRNVYRKLGVANRTEASHFAHIRGLVALPAHPSATDVGELASPRATTRRPLLTVAS